MLKYRWLAVACLGFWIGTGLTTAGAQDASNGSRGMFRKGTSPEALKVLAPQSDSRGQLMPLHAASVMEWLCGDSNVQTQLGGDRKACYGEMRKGVSKCSAQMQVNLPVGRSKMQATGKPDIVGFRRQLRECIQQDYIQRQSDVGRVATDIGEVSSDPLAPSMGLR